jgi:methyltransferase (TIGR00027 family)
MEARNFMSLRLAKAVDPFGNIIGLAGGHQDAKSKTIENHPSETAMGAALYRAMAARDDRPEIKGPDVYAHLFLTEELQQQLNARFIIRTLYGFFIARTAFIDHVFTEALKNKIPQIVFLGAGYDTRAYRFHDCLNGIRIFELDAAATQNRKRDILQKESVPISPQLSFVPVNFKTDDLNEMLEKAGFNPKLKSLFILEGVMYYLSPAEVDTVFDIVKNNSIPGSQFCFDLLTSKVPSTNSGEPIRSWIEKSDIQSFVTARGFAIVDQADPAEMEKRYLTLKDGTSAEKTFSCFHFVLAERRA